MEAGTEISDSHREILEHWKQVVEKTVRAPHFRFDKEYTPDEARKRAEDFATNPTESSFELLWDPLNAAQRRGAAANIYEKWHESGQTDAELADLIAEIHQADSYDSTWQGELGARKTLWELFGFLHIEEYPIINSCAQNGLAFFGYDCPGNYEGSVAEFNEFRTTYEAIVGHATAGTDHEVPINFEIDQLFNVIDKVTESDVERDVDEDVRQLYRLVLDEREDGRTDPEPYDSIKTATEDVLGKIDQRLTDNILATELATDSIGAWSEALSGIEPGVTIGAEQAAQCERIVEVYDQLSDELSRVAEQYSIGSLNRASPAETVFLALGRDLQSRASVRENLNQVKWGVIRDEEYELEGSQTIVPADDPPTDRENIATQLEEKGQLVFYGPPGTGKTYTAQQFARWWINTKTAGDTKAEQLELTTFHPSFSYEDFIEGLTAKEQDGAVEYIVEPGVFKEICKKAEDAYNANPAGETPPPYVLIVDEINRGNLAQIFGELMTLLEKDKRLDAANEARSSLAHSNESFAVPPNLYIIGTMNTADESIALLDAALRRRFRFYAFPPDFDKPLREYGLTDPESIVSEGGSRRNQLISASILALMELNERIRGINQLGKGKQIGHTHLFGHTTGSTVRDTWRFDILPQLEDYYFGKFDRMKEELFNNTATDLFDWDTERIGDFSTEVLYQSLCGIAGISEPAPLAPPAEDENNNNSSQHESVEDSWDAGEHTPAAFKQRVENNTESPVRERLIELWELGDDLGRLDAGRGELTATVNVEIPDFDPGVGFYQIEDDGGFEFRWNWLLRREENNLDRADMESMQPIFEELNDYRFEINESDEDSSEVNIEYSDTDLNNITDKEFENLVTVIKETHQYITTEVING